MPTLDLQEARWSDDTPSVESTGGRRCPGVTTTKTRTWKEVEVVVEEEEGEREEEEVVWRGRGWEGAGRGGSKHGKQEGAGRTAERGP